MTQDRHGDIRIFSRRHIERNRIPAVDLVLRRLRQGIGRHSDTIGVARAEVVAVDVARAQMKPEAPAIGLLELGHRKGGDRRLREPDHGRAGLAASKPSDTLSVRTAVNGSLLT